MFGSERGRFEEGGWFAPIPNVVDSFWRELELSAMNCLLLIQPCIFVPIRSGLGGQLAIINLLFNDLLNLLLSDFMLSLGWAILWTILKRMYL